MRDGFGETRRRSARRLAALGPSLALWALNLAHISHRLTGKAHDRPAITSLRLLAVLTVLFKYASARQAARASY